MIARVEELWGTEAYTDVYAPGHAGDQRFRRWSARTQRAIASPRVVAAHLRALLEVDVRPLLPLIQVPTLVLHQQDFELLPLAHGRYLATHIAGARLVEVPGDLPLWRDLLDTHDELAGRLVERWGGRLVKTTGDGILASFDGPGRAIGCAAGRREEVAGIGIEVRAGLHTGEVELRGDDLGGIAVNIAARIMAAAGPGEILVSRTVHDLVAGSDVALADRGSRLKGVEGDWQLFAVVGP
jgi:hypothetical protein